MSPVTVHGSRLLRLGWLLPVTYAAHVLEEWRGGFPAWWSRLTGVGLSVERFLSLNEIALALMTFGVVLAYAVRPLRWLFVAFGAAVLLNAASHLVACAATRSYSPGAITGALLWLPLGWLVIRAGRDGLSRRSFAAGVAVGVAMHAVVALMALLGG
ncbi:MAG TPA: HXXEE domain-containing protein [Pyrinomonadaceae bacterium]